MDTVREAALDIGGRVKTRQIRREKSTPFAVDSWTLAGAAENASGRDLGDAIRYTHLQVTSSLKNVFEAYGVRLWWR